MNFALIGSLMLAGLLGSGHCLAMCGGIQATLNQRAGSSTEALWFQLGRIGGYATLGALASALGSSMFSLMQLTPVVRPLWIIANVLAVVTGLTLLVYARQPRWLDTLGDRFASWSGLASRPAQLQPVQWHHNVGTRRSEWQGNPKSSPKSSRLLMTGAAWALLPCGFLYSAVLLVLVSADPMTGAVAMAGFAAATSIPLLLAQRLGQAAAKPTAALGRYLGARGLGALITLASLYGIYMIASGHADRLFCRTV